MVESLNYGGIIYRGLTVIHNQIQRHIK